MMNELLMQMLTARMGGSANPAMMDLLARMRSGDAGASLNMEELLAQQAQSNPMVAMLARQLAEQKAKRAAQEESEVIDVEATAEHVTDEGAAGAGPGEAAYATICELRENMKNMLADLEILRERHDMLAAALGACPLCWGQSLECRSCRGRGGPGFCIPDEALFEEFVLPAVRTLRAQRAKSAGSSEPVHANSIRTTNH